MLKLVIFAVLLSASLARAYRYRRNEGNEDSKHYYRPKYVYKFHDDEDTSSGIDSQEYKYVVKEDHHTDHQNSHVEDKHVTDTMAWGNAAEGGEKETNHHVEIEHEHGTSHQSFQMHHFKPVPLFSKKHDLQYVKKPVEISTTKHKFKFIHPKKKTYIKHEYVHKFNDDEEQEGKKEFEKSYQHKEYDFKDYKPIQFEEKKKLETHFYKAYQNKEFVLKDHTHKPTKLDDHKEFAYSSKAHHHDYQQPHHHKILDFRDYKPKAQQPHQHEDITVYRNNDYLEDDHHHPHHKEYHYYQPKPQPQQHHTVYQDSADDDDLYQGYEFPQEEESREQPHYVYEK